MENKLNIWLIFPIFLLQLCLLFVIPLVPFDFMYQVAIFVTISCVILILKFISEGDKINLFILYIFLYGIYGLSAPFSALQGWSDFPRYNFNRDFHESFILIYSIGLIGIITASFLLKFIHPRIYRHVNKADGALISSVFYFSISNQILMHILLFVANLIFFVNLSFTGLLLKIASTSKGLIAAEIGDQYLTFLPGPLVTVSIFLFISRRLVLGKGNILIFLLFLTPIISFYMVTGERSNLISFIIVSFATYSFWRKNWIKWKIILFSISSFLILTILYSTRSWLLIYVSGRGPWKEMKSEQFWKNLNPANSEFHTASGNLSNFLKEPSSLQPPTMFGIDTTYFTALFNIFPRWLSPVDKPVELSVIYNRTYHPDLEMINIRVGFSSWIEAIINGGLAGVFLHFFILTIILMLIDQYKFRISNFFIFFIPIGLLPIMIKFHRTSLATTIGYIFEFIVAWIIIFIILNIFFFLRNSNNLK